MSCEKPCSKLACSFGSLHLLCLFDFFIIESFLDGCLMRDASYIFKGKWVARVSKLYMLLTKLNLDVDLALLDCSILCVLNELPYPALA